MNIESEVARIVEEAVGKHWVPAADLASSRVSTSDRYKTAIHEAAHGVVAETLGAKVRAITIGANGDGVAWHATNITAVVQSMIGLAGPMAQAMYEGGGWSASPSDLGKVYGLVRECDSPDTARAAIRDTCDGTLKLIRTSWDDILKVADHLYKTGSIDGDTLRSMAGRRITYVI